MTVRKFLRFFKHFPYYMKKDFRWLMNKLKGNKKPVVKENKNMTKFCKQLKKIMNDCQNTQVIKYGNFYYACFKNKFGKFYKIWKNNEKFYINLDNKTTSFVINTDKTLSDIFIENGITVSYSGTDDENFTILLKSKSNLSATKENNVYKVYQTCGSQKPRLLYRITVVGVANTDTYTSWYEANMIMSKEKTEQTFKMEHDPVELLNTILINSNLT